MEAAMRTLFRKKYIEGVADRCFPEFEIRGRRVNEYLHAMEGALERVAECACPEERSARRGVWAASAR